MNNKLLNLAVAATLTLVTLSANADYTFTDLGSLGGTNSYANAINASGQVVGYAYTGVNAYNAAIAANEATYHATLWNGTTVTDLGTLGGNNSVATAINDSGQVVGTASVNYYNPTHATLWNGTTATDLTPGGNWSYANAINASGQVAGLAPNASGSHRATIWNGTTGTDLGLSPSGGNYSNAYAINASGQVVGVGMSDISRGTQHAELWNGTTVTDLGTLGGDNSFATSINASGQVVGSSNIAIIYATLHASLWNGTTVTDLGTLGGDFYRTYSTANAINNSGQIVGSSNIDVNGPTHATLWNGTVLTDLNSFLTASEVKAGWVLNSANGINDNGSIVGNASNSLLGITSHAFVMSVAAVPEADTYAMLLCGLGLMGFVVRRRKSA